MSNDRFERHRALFKERRTLAGFCRWMAMRFGGATKADEKRGLEPYTEEEWQEELRQDKEDAREYEKRDW
jgi:hypothetical protein